MRLFACFFGLLCDRGLYVFALAWLLARWPVGVLTCLFNCLFACLVVCGFASVRLFACLYNCLIDRLVD